MRRYNLAYYLLTVLLVMGGFAAMAQNQYGLMVLGVVSVCFCFIFLQQLRREIVVGSVHKTERTIELICLALLAAVFFCKIFYLEIPYLDSIIELLGIILMVVYVARMRSQYRHYRSVQAALASRLLIFYLSIVLLIVSSLAANFNKLTAQVTGTLGLILFAIYLLTGLAKKQFAIEGENISANNAIARRSATSWVLISLLAIFALYGGLTRGGFLPPLYSDQYPQAYFEMVNDAASGKEATVDGRFRYEDFKANYEKFVKTISQPK